MDFNEHLRQFLGEGVDDAEARDLAMAVLSRNIRDLKLAIAERLWLARQGALEDGAAAEAQLAAARALRERYLSALAEHRRIGAAPGGTQREATEGRCDGSLSAAAVEAPAGTPGARGGEAA